MEEGDISRFTCKCERTLLTTVFPNKVEGKIIGDYECLGTPVLYCESCGRIWIDQIEDDEGMRSYIPEGKKIDNLFGESTSSQYVEHFRRIFDNYFDDIQKVNRFDRDIEEIKFLKSVMKSIDEFKTSEVVIQIDERIKLLKRR